MSGSNSDASLKPLLEAQSKQVASAVAFFDRDVEQRMYEQATLASAHHALEHMVTALPVRQRRHPGNGHFELLEHALTLTSVDGFYAEFGVHKGASLTFLAGMIDRVIYGFDSFEGLPEAWSAAIKAGAFDLGGTQPDLSGIRFRNFRVVPGRFDASLPMFTAKVEGQAAFLHLDCYLYASTKTVLDNLSERIGPGTVIVFRQYFNYPGWQQQQFRAFQEFCDGRAYRYEAFTPTGTSVCLVMA